MSKEQETFILNNLESSNHQALDHKISVFLIGFDIKQKFLDKYSHDLLVANEETAILLEELNLEKFNKFKANKKFKAEKNEDTANNDEYDELIESDSEYGEDELNPFHNEAGDGVTTNGSSLLFIDYSIIQISRILEMLKHLYSTTKESERQTICNLVSTHTGISHDSKLELEVSEFSISSYNDASELSANKHETENESINQSLRQENSLGFSDSSQMNQLEMLKNQHDKNQKKQVPVTATTANYSTASKSAMHSRNACKKLKCPKCNWHYKYRETLDIHMREKHQTDSSRTERMCQYCIENSQHPRLGRGEQYKCGYKPYRCDICDYSTTTKGRRIFNYSNFYISIDKNFLCFAFVAKGNLSIHMQSDKHINNLKEVKANPKKKLESENELSTDNFDTDLDSNIHLEKQTNLEKISNTLDETVESKKQSFIQRKSNNVIFNGKSANNKTARHEVDSGIY